MSDNNRVGMGKTDLVIFMAGLLYAIGPFTDSLTQQTVVRADGELVDALPKYEYKKKLIRKLYE